MLYNDQTIARSSLPTVLIPSYVHYIALFSRQTFVRQTSAGRSAAVKAKESRSSDGGLNNNGENNPADDGWDFLNSDDVRMVDVYAFGTPYPPYPLVLS